MQSSQRRQLNMKCGDCTLAKESMGWEEVVVTGQPHRIVIRPISDTEFISSPPPIPGVSRTINSWVKRRDRIPPMPPKLPPELEPNSDTYEF